MIRAIILDDEVKGSSLLMHKLKDFSSLVEVIAVFNNPQEAVGKIQDLKADVLFLDIEMPNLNGFEFLERIGQFEFEVIFVTAYNMYTLDALRANALDYLLKPVDPEELGAALAKLVKKVESKIKLDKMSDHSKSVSNNLRVALPTLEGIYFVKNDEIIKVEAMSNYSVFCIVNKSKIIVSKTLKEFECILTEEKFLRINRSAIVNIDYIVKYKKGDGGTVELIDGSELEVSSSKKTMLIEKLLGN